MKRIILFVAILILMYPAKALCESTLRITGVGGAKPPQVCLGDPLNPDVVLDPSLSGTVNIDVATSGIPDGTTVKIKFKGIENINPPSTLVKDGMATIPLTLQAGDAKIIYAESDAYIPFTTKSASLGMLDKDEGTVSLYHLDGNLNDDSGHGYNLSYYPGWEPIQYTDGASPNSMGIYFWVTAGTYENRRVHRVNNPNGTGFTSPPLKWSTELFIKPLVDAPNETWYPLLLQDQNVIACILVGKSPLTGEPNKFILRHYGLNGISKSIEIPNPLKANKWSYVSFTHDGTLLKLYIDGQERGSVISNGNNGPHPWGDYGTAAGGIFSGNGAMLVIDEIRLSNVIRNREEIANNALEFTSTSLAFRKILGSHNDKEFSIEKKPKKEKVKKEIRAQTATLLPENNEPKVDEDTVALFHFNGTTKDSVSKKVLTGDPEVIGFEEGKNERDNSSINFEGKDDLTLVRKNLFDNTPKEWTIDFFAKPNDEFSPFPTGILTIDNSQIFAMVSYQRREEDKAVISATSLDASGKPSTVSAQTSFPKDTWTHIAVVYENKKLKLLVDGKTLSETELPSLYKGGDGTIKVGSDGGEGIFTGQIDELRISDKARSDSELEVYAKR